MAESRRVDDDGSGGEVPPLLDEYEVDFSRAVKVSVRDCDEAMLQRITDSYTVNAQDRNGHTLLMYAVDYGNLASVRFLIERGAAVNLKDNPVKYTALHYACASIDLSDDEAFEVMLLLLRAGADPSLKNWEGYTPGDMFDEST